MPHADPAGSEAESGRDASLFSTFGSRDKARLKILNQNVDVRSALKLFVNGLEHERRSLECKACRVYRHKLEAQAIDLKSGHPTNHSGCSHDGIIHHEVIGESPLVSEHYCDGCGLRLEQRISDSPGYSMSRR